MIAVDTSALFAIASGKARGLACAHVMAAEPRILTSAATVAEALIVANRRGLGAEMRRLMGGAGLQVTPVTGAGARDAADAYERWGKGLHPASLNYGDCFAYALAKSEDCALLFVGDDFSRTDLQAALPA